MSTAGVYAVSDKFMSKISGATYKGDPQIVLISLPSCGNLDNPKSINFTVAFGDRSDIKIFSNLMSRWTTFFECKYSTAFKI